MTTIFSREGAVKRVLTAIFSKEGAVKQILTAIFWKVVAINRILTAIFRKVEAVFQKWRLFFKKWKLFFENRWVFLLMCYLFVNDWGVSWKNGGYWGFLPVFIGKYLVFDGQHKIVWGDFMVFYMAVGLFFYDTLFFLWHIGYIGHIGYSMCPM